MPATTNRHKDIYKITLPDADYPLPPAVQMHGWLHRSPEDGDADVDSADERKDSSASEGDKLKEFFFGAKAERAYGCDCGAHYTSTPSVHLGGCPAGDRRR